MPPRSIRTPPPGSKSSYVPTFDSSTYRDLLIFEERLKTNALSLKKRKFRYQLFLSYLVIMIIISAIDFLFDTSILALPANFALQYIPPSYRPPPLYITTYVASGVLLVHGMTLLLFFASGMYSEKIGFANRYVSHANRTLRSFNMYLNVRPRPISTFSSFFRSSTSVPSSPSPPRSPSPNSRKSSSRRSATPVTITPIPPPQNPRGELIFNSRVDKSFREGYEKYRGAFERQRDEKQRETELLKSQRSYWNWFLMRSKRAASQAAGRLSAKDSMGTATPGHRGRTPSTSRPNSRKPSPASAISSHRRRSANMEALLQSVPEQSTLTHDLRRSVIEGEGRRTPRRSPSPVATSTRRSPSPTPSETSEGAVSDGESIIGVEAKLKGHDRSRAESFSFLLGKPDMSKIGEEDRGASL
ncbi:hypothetical protein FRC02_009598 [Tulasnella sp. 418]|nr:hypothetical protein FRC02_009598 [Tulasnella sp. 418]